MTSFCTRTRSNALNMGHQTQTWLATSDDPASKVIGRNWHHHRKQTPVREASDIAFQDQLLPNLAELSSVALF